MGVVQKQIKNENGLTIFPQGRIDVSNAYVFGNEVSELMGDVVNLDIDFSELVYISSAGLRVLLDVGRTIEGKQGVLRLVNMSKEVLDIFRMTGFDKIFTIIA